MTNNNNNKHTGPTDTELVAFLDSELDAAGRDRVIDALQSEPDTARRLGELERAGRAWATAFDALAGEAPRQRLEAGLHAALDQSMARRTWIQRRPPRVMGLVAAIAGLLVVGALADRALLHYRVMPAAEGEMAGDFDWREAVANYFALYTTDTLASPPATTDAEAINRLGGALGLRLTSAQVSLPDVSLARTVLFSYEGKPLAQIAYLDPVAGPMAFCIISGIEGSHPLMTESRAEMNIVYWSKEGHGFLLIGRGSTERLANFASILSDRI